MESILNYYIAEIRISPTVEFKIRVKHHLTGQEVRELLIFNESIKIEKKYDPIHGKRVIAVGKMRNGQMLIAYLHPINQEMGIWNLGTAWKK